MNLDHHTLFSCVSVSDFGHSVSRASNFEEDFLLLCRLRRCNHQLRVFRITSSTTREVGLMLFALSVSEIGTFVGVQSQTKTTFKRSQVVAEDVRILTATKWVVSARRKGEYAIVRTFARSIVSKASFLRRSRLSTFVSDAPATPPPPNLEPTRF